MTRDDEMLIHSSTTDREIPEDTCRLMVLGQADAGSTAGAIITALREDSVVLLRNLTAEVADATINNVASNLGLRESLELQAGFAAIHGHRGRVGKYFMTVNKRENYQFITPHSEGDSFINFQLASFFCFGNTTDGGVTILMNVDGSNPLWHSMRERVIKTKEGHRTLSSRETTLARARYRLSLPDAIVTKDDIIVGEPPSTIPGLPVVDVLTRSQQRYSRILDRRVHVYWDSIASIDLDAVPTFARLLKTTDLLREPPSGLTLSQMDNSSIRRIWHSGVDHARLFRSRITLKLAPGDLIIQNNLTWAHGVSNWSPHSGVRSVAAAFA